MSFARYSTRSPVGVRLIWNQQHRPFTSTVAQWAKSKGAKKNEENVPRETVEIVDTKKRMEEAKKKFEEALALHQKKINEVRLGKSNPQVFDDLKIKVDGEEYPFTAVAQTTMKGGRFLNVTVFDPSHSKTIVSAILASGLNMTPEQDKTNPQLLKVPLPPPTADSKKATLKQLKETFENFKNHPHNKHCLASIRTHYLKDLKRNKTDESVKKFIADFEKIQKKYSNLLADQFKAAEKTLMK